MINLNNLCNFTRIKQFHKHKFQFITIHKFYNALIIILKGVKCLIHSKSSNHIY